MVVVGCTGRPARGECDLGRGPATRADLWRRFTTRPA